MTTPKGFAAPSPLGAARGEARKAEMPRCLFLYLPDPLARQTRASHTHPPACLRAHLATYVPIYHHACLLNHDLATYIPSPCMPTQPRLSDLPSCMPTQPLLSDLHTYHHACLLNYVRTYHRAHLATYIPTYLPTYADKFAEPHPSRTDPYSEFAYDNREYAASLRPCQRCARPQDNRKLSQTNSK